ncbi:MAG: glycosyl hydrolase family 28-related protein [Bacteroidota bacterium]
MKNAHIATFFLILFGLTSCSLDNKNHDGLYNVVDYGAVGDAITLNTTSFQKALDLASEADGKVIIPKGDFLIGTIYIKSNTILELMPGSRLLGSFLGIDSVGMKAKAAIVVSNVNKFSLDGLDITWNQTDNKPNWAYSLSAHIEEIS